MTGLEISHPNISFEGNPFKTPTPLFFGTGECELLYDDDDVEGYEEFTKLGNRTELQIEKNAVRDIILLGAMIGFDKEAALAGKGAGKFWARNRMIDK